MRFISKFSGVIFAFATGGVFGFLPCSSIATTAFEEQLQELRKHESMLELAKVDFRIAESRGSLSAAEKADFASWIGQLKIRIAEDCTALQEMTSSPLPDDLACDQFQPTQPSAAEIDLSNEQTEAERSDQLIGQLNHSIGEFDETLLREQARIKAKTPRSPTTAGTSGGGSGSDGSEQASDQADMAQANGKATDEGTSQEAEMSGGMTQEQQAQTGQAGKAGDGPAGTSPPIPEDIPDGSDDDVVARQLREAAEKEQDPVLREKLWEEYRRYKAGTG